MTGHLVRDFVDDFKELGTTRFRSAHPLPVLAWVGTVGDLDQEQARRRPTSRMEAKALERDLEIARLVNRVWLVCKGEGRGRTREIVAGRAGDNDLVIPEYSVSQQHCSFRTTVNRLLRSRPRRLFITDLDSLNGSAVRGARLEPGVETELCAGDELAMGRLRFVVLDADGFLRKVAEAAGVRLDD
jgi:hypothetical protein